MVVFVVWGKFFGFVGDILVVVVEYVGVLG